jgi:hypothetical protein
VTGPDIVYSLFLKQNSIPFSSNHEKGRYHRRSSSSPSLVTYRQRSFKVNLGSDWVNRNTAILQQLAVTQLVKKFPIFPNPKIHFMFIKNTII